MDNQVANLLEKLAQKMGTTTEYLWGVLLRQAPIDATITLIQIVVVFIAAYGLYRLHVKLSETSEGSSYSTYDDNDAYGFAMMLAAITVVILVIISFFCIHSVITGFVNPEYWALKEILSAVKGN